MATQLPDLKNDDYVDLDKALTSLRRKSKSLPDFQLIAQAAETKNKTLDLKNIQNLFIITSASLLPEISDTIKGASQTGKLRAVFVHSDMPQIWLSQYFSRAGLRLSKNMLVIPSSDLHTPRVVMQAWSWDSQHDLIANACVIENDKLLVINCALDTFEVSFNDLPAFKKIPKKERAEFVIDPDGSNLHWPGPDIHMNMDSFRYVLDPKYRKEVDSRNLAHNKNFGKAVAILRKKSDFNQSNVPNISERTIRNIENEGARPSLSTIKKLAEAHKMTANEYLEEIGDLIKSMSE